MKAKLNKNAHRLRCVPSYYARIGVAAAHRDRRVHVLYVVLTTISCGKRTRDMNSTVGFRVSVSSHRAAASSYASAMQFVVSHKLSAHIFSWLDFGGTATAPLQIYGGASPIKCNKNLSFACLAVDDNFSFFHSLRADLEIDLLHFYFHVTCVCRRTRLLWER